MHKKFAVLEYADKREDIPYKQLLQKSKESAVNDWYVRNYNPFKLKSVNILNEKGYVVTLPFTYDDLFTYDDIFAEDDYAAKNEVIKLALFKTVDALKEYGVEIVLPPSGLPFYLDTEINVAYGDKLFSFFILESSVKALKLMGKNIKDCEFLIINGDDDLTECIIDNLYENINYLTVMDKELTPRFTDKAEDIFTQQGLSVRFSEGSINAVKSADIIINTDYNSPKYDYAYDKEAIYIDLTDNKIRRKELISRRKDMFIFDDIKLCVDGHNMDLDMFELLMYVKNRDYKQFRLRGYHTEYVKNIKSKLTELDIRVKYFYCLDKRI